MYPFVLFLTVNIFVRCQLQILYNIWFNLGTLDTKNGPPKQMLYILTRVLGTRYIGIWYIDTRWTLYIGLHGKYTSPFFLCKLYDSVESGASKGNCTARNRNNFADVLLSQTRSGMVQKRCTLTCRVQTCCPPQVFS